MRILYGVVGEGMGHATRSRVILQHLLTSGHTVRVVVSGRAHRFLVDAFAGRAGITIDEIAGLHFIYEDNAVDKSESLLSNLDEAPTSIRKNLAVYRQVAEDNFAPEVVISDFESWAFFYAKNHRIPVISIDNIQMINRCRHDETITGRRGLSARLAELAVKIKLPGAYHYLITSFFFPPVRKRRTTLVPPILRPEILAARREPAEHVLVYQTAAANEALVPTLQELPGEFRVYGLRRAGREKNVTFCEFSPTGFVDDLRTARAVIAGGGYSLMGESVHLQVPMLSVPLEKQYEQQLNARYLAHLGYGAWAETLSTDVIADFLAQTDSLAASLEGYIPRNNTMTFGCLDELLRCVALGESAPATLRHDAMGTHGDPC